MDEKISKLQKMIDEASNIVILDGAGTSTDSGIKDFRSQNGLYNMKSKYPVEYMLSIDFFKNNPQEFYNFYRKNMNFLSYEPNIIHKYLKHLEDAGKLKAIVTQNIDGLYKKACLQNVYEMHGTIYSNHCLKCHKYYNSNYIFNLNNSFICSCGGLIKPDFVFYGEMLPQKAFDAAQYYIFNADLLLVLGTSLTVEPVCSFVNLFRGKHLVIINNTPTPYDYKADLIIHENLKHIFEKLIIKKY